MASATSASRPCIEVAAGCLIDTQGRVLIAQRPIGKIAAGQWEFPGGKIEAGESAYEALRRELHEEIGIDIEAAQPLIRIVHDYSERRVRLDCWKVLRWRGEPAGREAQALAWVTPQTITDYPILAADAPIISALRLPSDYVFTPPRMTPASLLSALPRLPAAALLRLRFPELDDHDYATLAASVLPAAQALGLRVVLDRAPEMVARLGADAWHATDACLRDLDERPDVPLCLASTHGADGLRRARALGFDAAVLGSVSATLSHPGSAVLGLSEASRLTQAANLPVYWIGGLQRDQLASVQQHYAQGIAAIRAYWPA
ncbi:Nudix family hydrolase [Solimonas terrae]|uniref:8-oxo-dGTP diphosphatase n=1 Tax=Solimonas terrae TaxID=1396819 RepID=A0A6M2BUI2_9GAMM|nr:Nudix family hydrolase [Solimonas terrae]NGY05783.1 Nudix family hydrolase [Solimonas terrae]